MQQFKTLIFQFKMLEKIGYKAIGRAYSDLASMGAYPEWVLINIVAPKEMYLCF